MQVMGKVMDFTVSRLKSYESAVLLVTLSKDCALGDEHTKDQFTSYFGAISHFILLKCFFNSGTVHSGHPRVALFRVVSR